jgi:hypothetical protein
MQDKSDNNIWLNLESGNWENALKEAKKLVKLDPQNIENTNLAKYISKINDIVYLAIHGNEQEKAQSAKKLEDIAAVLPRLAELSSFKALLESTKAFAIPVIEKKSPESVVKKRQGWEPIELLNPADQKDIPSRTSSPPEEIVVGKNQKQKQSKFFSYSSKSGIVVTFIMSIIVILIVDVGAYQYIKAQPPDTTAFRTNRVLLGLETDGPANTLLLGDSTCDVDLHNGPFADRLGGTALSLGTVSQTSFLLDAWFLADYVERFGAPENVIEVRASPSSYSITHSSEYMAAVPFSWNYWEHLGISPDWKSGEKAALFFTRYGVLYSDADTLKNRFIPPFDLFSHETQAKDTSGKGYIGTVTADTYRQTLDIEKRKPAILFQQFNPCEDTTIALRFMSDLARSKHFQLYFLFQPEWDEAVQAGLRADTLEAQINYLSQFIDPTYVHIVRDDSLTFAKAQMASHNHLLPPAERIYTEMNVNIIAAIQNQLTAQQAIPLKLESATPDKSQYKTGDKPVITLKVSAQDGNSLADFKGNVSCLLKPAGSSDGEWVARASAVRMTLNDNGSQGITLTLSKGKIVDSGSYDLVVFLRQDVGNLSNETRVELKNITVVN